MPHRYCGDASHRSLFDPALRHLDRVWHSSGSSERPTHQERARSQERCAGASMVDEASHLWPASDSFRLEDRMESVRTIWRLRDRHVKDASRAVQHMQKALTKMNIQLANVISDITGVSGQAIITEILKGERDPWKLADLKHEMVKASREEVARSLEGNWRADLLFELRQAVDSYHFAHQQMRECDRKLKSFLASLPTRTLEKPNRSGDAPPATTPQQRKARKKPKTRRNEPTIDLKAELKR